VIDSQALGRPEILQRIEQEQRARRLRFRGTFGLVWLALVGGLVLVLWSSGNINLAFYDRWAAFILEGTWTTLVICVSSIILATALAVVGAIARLSPNAVVYAVASLYVSLVRGTPAARPDLLRLPRPARGRDRARSDRGRHPRPRLQLRRLHDRDLPGRHPGRAARPARGGPGAGHAEALILRRIVLPQAIRIVIPAIGNEFIAMIKDSALVSVISVTELLWRARRAGTGAFQTLPALLLAARCTGS
jgi:polar amino acid transport system permease protein